MPDGPTVIFVVAVTANGGLLLTATSTSQFVLHLMLACYASYSFGRWHGVIDTLAKINRAVTGDEGG